VTGRDRGEPLRVGVLGCASIAWRRLLPAFAAAPDYRVAAIASRDPDKARAFTGRFGGEPVHGYAGLLERPDVDAVYLALPTGMHVEWVGRALRAGKHVLAEKPLATTAEHAAELTALAAARGLVLRENYLFRHHAQHAAVRALLAGGAIGTVHAFAAAFGIPRRPADDIRHRPELGGGALLDVGVYPIGAAGLFLGDGLRVLGAHLAVDGTTGVDVAGAALLRDADGVTASLSFGMEHRYRNRYEFWGSDGHLSLDRVFTPPADQAPEVRIERADGVELIALPPQDQVAAALAAFAAAVRAGAAAQAAAEEAARSVRQAALVDAVRAAAEGTEPEREPRCGI
jgi:dTDP-3,4-didehydro-2,6-dideoxy-alpha-D-glucose 3-reductase